MFLGRKEELKILYKAKEELLKGKGFVYFISGIKGSGKTSLLNEFLQTIEDVEVIYIDIKKLSLSPDLFSLYFIGNIFFSLAGEKEDKTNYFSKTFQKRVVEELKEERITKHADRFYEEIEKQKPNYPLLLKLAFQFPSVISQSLSLKLIILLDEFQEISFLSNYRIDPYELFKTSIDDSVLWILASSKKAPSFYFKRNISLSSLSNEDIAPMVSNWTEGAINRLFEITGGIPYPLFVLLDCLSGKESVDAFLVDKVLQKELKDNGRLYYYCEQILDSTISSARGEGLIRASLISLAKNDNASLSTIAKDIRRSPGVTRSLLLRLISTEIIQFKDKKYFIPNKLLSLWIRIHYYGEKQEPKDPIIEILKSFNGQKVSGELFAKEQDISLPLFSSIKIRDDGFVSAEGEKEKWLIKVFEKGIATRKDIEGLINSARKVNVIPWFISMDGFAGDVFFPKMDTMLSIKDDIKTLCEILTKGE